MFDPDAGMPRLNRGLVYLGACLIAGIRLEGPFAPWLFEGPMDGEMFLAWERQGSAPALRPGDVVIPDNPATHKIRGVRETIEAAGARLRYLPPYSPDFNPIEQFFAKLKSILRKIAAYTLKGIAFTVDSLCKAIVFCLDQISRAECAAYLANSGYGQPKRETL